MENFEVGFLVDDVQKVIHIEKSEAVDGWFAAIPVATSIINEQYPDEDTNIEFLFATTAAVEE
jgi:hypothetical protein